MGRWRLDETEGRNWAAGKATIDQQGTTWTLSGRAATKKNMTSVRVIGPRYRTDLVARHRSASERNVLCATGPDLGDAVLASASAGHPG